MASRSQPIGYTTMQIVLHWLIAALVIFQIVFGENIVPAWRAFRRGLEANSADAFAANIHVVVGIAIFVLAVWRFALRLRYGAPPPPASESVVLKWISTATHVVLYLVIFGMPITGGMAWFGGFEAAGEVHEIGKPVVVVFVALHAAGALYQHFVSKSDVLVRMLKPRRRAEA